MALSNKIIEIICFWNVQVISTKITEILIFPVYLEYKILHFLYTENLKSSFHIGNFGHFVASSFQQIVVL
jgi:hypothetical protein